MRKLLLTAAAVAAFVSPIAVSTAQAQAAAAPASPHTFTGNMTIGSDYRFRGISQTFTGPTIQGGIDYSHSSGFYVGNWNSNVSGVSYTNGNNIEMDFYGGWKGSWGDWGLDVGALYYYYDSARANAMNIAATSAVAHATNSSNKYNNGELYIGGSWKWLSAKYSYAVTDYFGLNGSVARMTQSKDCFMAVTGACAGTRAGFLAASNEDRGSSKGTGYFQIDATYEFAPKWNVIGHIGKATIKNYGELSYTDYKLGVTYDLSGWVLGAAAVGTNANKQWYAGQRAVSGANNTKDLGTPTLVLTVAKTF